MAAAAAAASTAQPRKVSDARNAPPQVAHTVPPGCSPALPPASHSRAAARHCRQKTWPQRVTDASSGTSPQSPQTTAPSRSADNSAACVSGASRRTAAISAAVARGARRPPHMLLPAPERSSHGWLHACRSRSSWQSTLTNCPPLPPPLPPASSLPPFARASCCSDARASASTCSSAQGKRVENQRGCMRKWRVG